EQPELQPICIDLDPFGKPEQDSEQLRAEIFSADGEDQIAWRDAKRFVARLVHKPLGQAIDGVPAPLLQLEVSERGLLDDLQLKPLVRRSPGAGEVEIRVHATGMNFRDVLKALGQYPGEPSPLGDECAGEIVRL